MRCKECGQPVEPEASFCDQCRCPVGVTGATIRLTPDLAFGSGVGAANFALTQVRSGMTVYYADGVRLGKVRDYGMGATPRPVRSSVTKTCVPAWKLPMVG